MSDFDKSFTKARYKEFYSSQLATEQLIKIYKPEKVFIDEHISEYYFFLKKYEAEIIIINTKLSTKKVRRC